MSCGSWCVYYRDRDTAAICKHCSNYEGPRARARVELGKIDPFRLAKMLAEKQEKERRSKIPKLSDCPNCHKHSLFYNSVDDAFECLNPKCQTSTAPH